MQTLYFYNHYRSIQHLLSTFDSPTPALRAQVLTWGQGPPEWHLLPWTHTELQWQVHFRFLTRVCLAPRGKCCRVKVKRRIQLGVVSEILDPRNPFSSFAQDFG